MDKFKIGDLVSPVRDYPSIKAYEVGTISAKYDDYGRMKEEAWWINCPKGAQCWLHAKDLIHCAALTIQPATLAQPVTFQPGEIVEAVRGYPGYFTIGKLYTVTKFQDNGGVPWVWIDTCDTGGPSSWDAGAFKKQQIASQQIASHSHTMPTGTIVASSTASSLNDLGKTEVEQYVEEHYKSAEQERKERIWKALQGAAKQ